MPRNKSAAQKSLDAYNAMQRKPHFIYLLCDPDTMQIRYVGCTGNLKQRYAGHCAVAGKPTPLRVWIRELKAQGKKPAIVLHETVIGESAALDREREVIAEMYRRYGADVLLNRACISHIRFSVALEHARKRAAQAQGAVQ